MGSTLCRNGLVGRLGMIVGGSFSFDQVDEDAINFQLLGDPARI